jgi:hypothetical protein
MGPFRQKAKIVDQKKEERKSDRRSEGSRGGTARRAESSRGGDGEQ